MNTEQRSPAELLSLIEELAEQYRATCGLSVQTANEVLRETVS